MPIPIEKLRAVTKIVTHKNCPDGVASAMILKDVLPDATIEFQHYDDEAHSNHEPEPGVLFCDFSPSKTGDLDGWVKAGAIVLDHHKSQREVVERFGELGVFADEHEEPGVCGATLAYREVWAPLMQHPSSSRPINGPTVEEFATLSGIRDTWQKNDPRWREACEQAEAVRFWPEEELVGLPVGSWPEKLALGSVLFNKRLRGAQKAIDNGWRFITPSGRRVIVFEGLRQTSDAAEILGSEVDFVVGFGFVCESNKPKMIYSTRSHTDFDCSAFATAHGGGGHLRAAGFSISDYDPMTAANPYALIHKLLESWSEG